MKQTIKQIIFYFCVLILAQIVTTGLFALLRPLIGESVTLPWGDHRVISTDVLTLIMSSLVSSLIVIALFIRLHWITPEGPFLRTRPWDSLMWVAFLSLGLIVPMELLQEGLNLNMPASLEYLFKEMMREPLGYIAIGMCAPLAEEIVFRGAILRKLLTLFPDKAAGTAIQRNGHWIAIIISAAVFGAVHGNLPQFVNAFIAGLILGWLYYRTGSIIPGIVYHWVNNSVAYLICNLAPQLDDNKLIDLFHGNTRGLLLLVLSALMVAVPSFWQLTKRLKRS